jgi:hypothetical protein
MGITDTLKRLDGNSSLSNEFRVHTSHGAVLSVLTILLIGYLTVTEHVYNFTTVIVEKVHANATTPAGLEIEFDITLHSVQCAILAIDANDPTGQRQSLHLDKTHHIWKHRLKDGRLVGQRSKLEMGSTLLEEQHFLDTLHNHTDDDEVVAMKDIHMKEEECGSCYGAGEGSECCNTCDDVKRAYARHGWVLTKTENLAQCQDQVTSKDEEGEGCNVHGRVALSTGGGNLHLAPNRGLEEDERVYSVVDHFLRTFEQFNVSHTINKIRFGQEYPGHVHQLDRESRYLQDSYGMYQYYLQIVPTTYKFLDGRTIETNQYSVTEHMRHVSPGSGRGLPGVFLFYEVSALHVVIEEYRRGWIAFFTSTAAIVGGVVTIMGMIDQALYSRLSARKDVGLMR